MDLQINIKEISTVQAVITLAGNLDASTGTKFVGQVENLIHLKFTHFIVDMADLSSVDSSGLAALVTCLKLTRKVGGILTLAGLSKPILEIFQLTKLAQIFRIYSDRTSALNSLFLHPANPDYTIHSTNHQTRQQKVDGKDQHPVMHREGSLSYSLNTLLGRNQAQRMSSKSATIGWQKGTVRWLSVIGVLAVGMLVIIGWGRDIHLNASIFGLPPLSLVTASVPPMETHAIETHPIETPITSSELFSVSHTTLNNERQRSDSLHNIVLTQTDLPMIVPFTLTVDAAMAADATTAVSTTVGTIIDAEAQQPSLPLATSTPSATASPTALPTATATPPPSATNTPKATPKPRRPTPTPVATRIRNVVAPTDNLANAKVELLEPVEKDTLLDKRPFRWQSNFTLPPGYAYEVVFWQRGEDPLLQGKGYAGLTVKQQINGSAESFHQRNAPPGEYHWGLLLVIKQPYQRVKYLGGDNVIYVR